jgi:ribosomal-protein-alanine N-acetyltransferase
LEWFAAADQQTDNVMGVCWLAPMGVKWCEALGITPPAIELGYRFARKHWGRGYATEAAATMLRRGFEELRLPRIGAIVDVRNVASERVLQKIGMRYQRAAECEGVSINYYSLDRDDFAEAESPQ